MYCMYVWLRAVRSRPFHIHTAVADKQTSTALNPFPWNKTTTTPEAVTILGGVGWGGGGTYRLRDCVHVRSLRCPWCPSAQAVGDGDHMVCSMQALRGQDLGLGASGGSGGLGGLGAATWLEAEAALPDSVVSAP